VFTLESKYVDLCFCFVPLGRMQAILDFGVCYALNIIKMGLNKDWNHAMNKLTIFYPDMWWFWRDSAQSPAIIKSYVE